MNYSFDEKGNLLPQTIKKSHLAFFYGVCPRQFRKELENVMTIHVGWSYSTKEVEKIFKHFGSVPSKADVERAISKIKEYTSAIRSDGVKRYSKG